MLEFFFYYYYHLQSISGTVTCFEVLTDTWSAVALRPMSLDCYIEIRATRKILETTTIAVLCI